MCSTPKDLNAKELSELIPLVALVAVLGIYSQTDFNDHRCERRKMLVLMDQKALQDKTKELLMKANTIGGNH